MTIPQNGIRADASIPAAITGCADRDHLAAEVLDMFDGKLNGKPAPGWPELAGMLATHLRHTIQLANGATEPGTLHLQRQLARAEVQLDTIRRVVAAPARTCGCDRPHPPGATWCYVCDGSLPGAR